MIHQGTAGTKGAPRDMEIHLREVLATTRRMAEIIAFHSGQPAREGRAGHRPRLLHDARGGQGLRPHRRHHRAEARARAARPTELELDPIREAVAQWRRTTRRLTRARPSAPDRSRSAASRAARSCPRATPWDAVTCACGSLTVSGRPWRPTVSWSGPRLWLVRGVRAGRRDARRREPTTRRPERRPTTRRKATRGRARDRSASRRSLRAWPKVLVTGMSGTGKSSVLRGPRRARPRGRSTRTPTRGAGGSSTTMGRLTGCGARTRSAGCSPATRGGHLFVAGCKTNQGAFYASSTTSRVLSPPPTCS